MRRPILAANWKMHKTRGEADAFVRAFRDCGDLPGGVDVVVCGPFTALDRLAQGLKGTGVAVGAQDLFWEPHGAYTGEISGPMLVDAGCRYVIVGHSERRQYFGETDETVARKVDAAYRFGLIPIACVGETLEERESGRTRDVVLRQVRAIVATLTLSQAPTLVLAYEPVWAIGSGKAATPDDAQEVCAAIRGAVRDAFGDEVSGAVRIQYGGSVKPENVRSFLDLPDVDGALVGGASLDAAAFYKLISA